jgi:hypothetical protein
MPLVKTDNHEAHEVTRRKTSATGLRVTSRASWFVPLRNNKGPESLRTSFVFENLKL